MKIAILHLQSTGAAIAGTIAAELSAGGDDCEIHRNGQRGGLGSLVAGLWNSYDGLVFVMASGIVVRAISSLITDKRTDPAVVVADAAGRYAISLLSGHEGGANDLAWRVGAALDAEPVVTTASDTNRRLVVGVGCRRGVEPDAVVHAATDALSRLGASPAEVRCAATVQAKRQDPGLRAGLASLGIPLRFIDHRRINEFSGPYEPSSAAERHIGVSAVAEPCALIAARRGALVLDRCVVGPVTIAIAKDDSWGEDDTGRTLSPADSANRAAATSHAVAPTTSPGTAGRATPGTLTIVGIGPGSEELIAPAAQEVIRSADLVVGYSRYLTLIDELIGTTERFSTGMRRERERATHAVTEAAAGRNVVVVSSGDPGVYGLSGLVLEILLSHPEPRPRTRVIPGVSAAHAAACLLGAPLMHDHAVISLSDLLTEWDTIANRLELAAQGDFVVALYNPKSRSRTTQLLEARDTFLRHRAASTPVGIVTSAYREGSEVTLCTLETLADKLEIIGMSSTVIIGNSTTFVNRDWMITPRGYGRR